MYVSQLTKDMKKVNWQAIDQEKIFAKQVSDKRKYPEHIKNSYISIIKT